MTVREVNTTMLKNTERLAECKANRGRAKWGHQSGTHLFIIFHRIY
jgi:hypothetical protein